MKTEDREKRDSSVEKEESLTTLRPALYTLDKVQLQRQMSEWNVISEIEASLTVVLSGTGIQHENIPVKTNTVHLIFCTRLPPYLN